MLCCHKHNLLFRIMETYKLQMALQNNKGILFLQQKTIYMYETWTVKQVSLELLCCYVHMLKEHRFINKSSLKLMWLQLVVMETESPHDYQYIYLMQQKQKQTNMLNLAQVLLVRLNQCVGYIENLRKNIHQLITTLPILTLNQKQF